MQTSSPFTSWSVRLRQVLSPIEIFTLLAVACSVIVIDLYGRPFFFLFEGHAKIILNQLQWLLPCILARYLFALFRVPRKTAHVFFLLFYCVLAVAFFGSEIEASLTRSHVLGKTDVIFTRLAWINGSLFLLAVLLSVARAKKDRAHFKSVVTDELRQDLYALRLLVSLLLCFSIYSNLKAMVPVLHPNKLYDDLFYRLDCLMFLGHDPFAWLNSFKSPAFRDLMLRSYFFFYFIVVFGLTGTLVFGSVRHFEKTLASFVIAYIFGLVGYVIFPAVGPAFYKATAGIFEFTRDNPLKISLYRQYLYFSKDPWLARIVPFNGLAAFPSLHIAHSLLFMYYLWFAKKALVYILIIPFVLLAVSTIYLGWHYVVDIPAGAVVAVSTIYCVKRFYAEGTKDRNSDDAGKDEPPPPAGTS